MALVVQQSREALESLYDRYSRAIYSLAVSLLRDPGAAEEVTQDVFLSVWRRGASYRPKRGKVTAWLFSIAHHRTIDEIRRRRRELEHVREGVDVTNEPSTGMDDPLECATAQYQRSRLKGALATLRPEAHERPRSWTLTLTRASPAASRCGRTGRCWRAWPSPSHRWKFPNGSASGCSPRLAAGL